MDPNTAPTPTATPIVVLPPAVATAAPSPSALIAPMLAAVSSGGTPATVRRAVAAAVGVAVPFVSAFTMSRWGFGLSDVGLGFVETIVAGYVTQGVINEISARSHAVALANAATPQAAIDDLNRGPVPVAP